MKIGTVTGSVHPITQADCLKGQHFLTVQIGAETLVAADQTGAAPGDRVLLTTGMVASRYCMDAPIDAAAVAILPAGEPSR